MEIMEEVKNEITIKREPGRFYVTIGEHDSQLIYKLINGVVDIVEVLVNEQHRGRSIGTQLTQAAFDFAKEHGYKVAASCSFVKESFIPKHEELNDMVVDEKTLFYKAKKRSGFF